MSGEKHFVVTGGAGTEAGRVERLEEGSIAEHDAEHDSQLFIKVIGSIVLLVLLGFVFVFVANPQAISERIAVQKQREDERQIKALQREVMEATGKGYSIIDSPLDSARD